MSSKFIDFLRGYEKSEESFEKSYVYKANERFTEYLISGIGSSLSGKLMNNRFAKFLSALKERIIFASSRAYGTLFLSFGILTLLIHFAEYYFKQLPTSPAFSLIVGAVFAVLSIPLLFSDVPFADIFQRWSVTNTLIFDWLCIKHARKSDNNTQPLIAAVPILIGAIIATLGFFFSVKLVLIVVLSLVFLSLAVASPEFSFIATLLCLPLLPVLPHSSVILVSAVLVTAVSFIGKVAVGKRLFHFEQYDCILLLMMLFYFISGIFNKGLESFESSLVFIAICTVYFLASNIIVNRRIADNSVNAVIVSSVPTAIYSIIHYFVSDTRPEWIDPIFAQTIKSRASGPFGNPNVYAVYLLVCTVFAIGFAFAKSRRAWRPLYLTVAALNALVLVFTWTRGAWLALILGGIAFLVIKSLRTPKLLLIPLLAVPVGLVFIPSSVASRFLSIFSLSDTSTLSRLSIWRSTLEMIKHNLFIGAGVGEGAFSVEFSKYAEDSVTAPHSHNLFLEIASEAGIFALILFVLLLIVRLRHRTSYSFFLKRSSVESICTVCGVSVFTLLVFGLTDYIWYSSPMLLLFWFAFGLGSASMRIARKEYDEQVASLHDGSSAYSAAADFTVS